MNRQRMQKLFLTVALAAFPSAVVGFAPSPTIGRKQSSQLRQSNDILINDDHVVSPTHSLTRATFLSTLLTSSTAILTTLPQPSLALVKGNAPPPKKKPPSDGATDETKKCRNVEECQEMAERQETLRMQQEAERAANGPKAQVVGGSRYLDIVEEGRDGATEGARVATKGDEVEVFYKVLKLGKRSYDGLSGEGTVVFSRGYALEDDEKNVGDHSFKFKIGDSNVIKALNDAVPGMAVGALRRISVTPQNGWEKNTKQCDGGPGGSGSGGDLKTDYVVVPTATMVEQEACFDRNKLPFPSTYAQERRMAQRFDQSLIMEVRLVNVL
ncbi:predicted protein [Thalassiosira pseudonana CCMP1335]|uniref:peptidylprolyl isomerase n=1 Tax=Thalassiosira pseudonana TaxID=35128 RepID=B8LCF6_THAPS|nr:predicted protein [Thalassiosira pseudonana CCMP1335]EED86976.1 predicted protein [Thalassiosira pseudonana CCMP1335]